MDDTRLQCITTRLKDLNKEISDLEWTAEPQVGGPDKLQALYLERENLEYLLQKGDLYVPYF